MTVKEFQELYPTREDKEKALSAMNDNEIDELIADSNNVYGKIFYSKFKSSQRNRKVLFTAEHQNWSMHTIEDWQQTKYVLFEDGTLQSIVFEGGSIFAHEKTISEDDMQFIKNNIKKFVYNVPEIDACDGDAWAFEGPDYCFDFGYIYGSDLERIASILL